MTLFVKKRAKARFLFLKPFALLLLRRMPRLWAMSRFFRASRSGISLVRRANMAVFAERSSEKGGEARVDQAAFCRKKEQRMLLHPLPSLFKSFFGMHLLGALSQNDKKCTFYAI